MEKPDGPTHTVEQNMLDFVMFHKAQYTKVRHMLVKNKNTKLKIKPAGYPQSQITKPSVAGSETFVKVPANNTHRCTGAFICWRAFFLIEIIIIPFTGSS